jgi:eukaryotic-like serine/threonine-protein kinase
VNVGAVFAGRYLVEEVANDSGICAVLRVRHELLGQRMSIRVLRDPSIIGSSALLVNEGKRRARLPPNPHLAAMLDLGEFDGAPFMAGQWIEGWDLVRLLAHKGRFVPKEACDCIAQASTALATAHAEQVFHEDLKPSKLVVGMSTNNEVRVSVIDLGLRKPMVNGHEARYMSPEQIQGLPLDARSNIWSLGIVLYELLAGVVPFKADSVGELLLAQQEPFPPLWADGEVVDVIRRCLAFNSRERVPDAITLARMLVPLGMQKKTLASPQ